MSAKIIPNPFQNKSCKGKPTRLYGRGGFEAPAPLRAWLLRNPRAPSGVAVTNPRAPSGVAVTKTTRPFRRSGYETPKPRASSGGAVIITPRPFGLGSYKNPAPLRVGRLRLRNLTPLPERATSTSTAARPRPLNFNNETPAPLEAKWPRRRPKAARVCAASCVHGGCGVPCHRRAC